MDYTTTTAVPTQVSQGLTSAIKAGRVTRGRVCFCVPAAKSTSVLIYIQHTVVFVSLLKISELYIISKSYGGPYKKHIITAHVLQTTPCLTTTAVSTQVSHGLISAIKVGRVKRGRVCFCVLASESTSVLIYILNTVHTVLFCITFKIQRAVHHF